MTKRIENVLEIGAGILRTVAPFVVTLFLLLAFLGARDLFGQTYILAPNAKFTGLDNSGNPISSGKLCTYTAGTTTLLTSYSDNAGTPNANPVVLDSAGRATIYLTTAAYKFELRSATATNCTTGSIIWTQDNVVAPTSVTITGTANTVAKFNATGNNVTNSSITDTGSAVSIAVITTITTSATVPLVIGGSAATSTLILQSTSGVGTTDNVQLRAGNNGAVLMLFANTGGISVNTFSTTSLTVTNLTNTRVPITGTGGLFGDSANLTWSSPALTIGVAASTTGQLKLTGATSGTATLTCGATCGTPTVTIGTTSGTIAMVGDSLQQFAATTSAQLASVISNETGSGLLVFDTSPTLVTPTLGVATGTRLGLGAAADANIIAWVQGSAVNKLTLHDTSAGRRIAYQVNEPSFTNNGYRFYADSSTGFYGFYGLSAGVEDANPTLGWLRSSGNVTIGSTTTTGMLNVGTSAQFQVSSTGMITTTGVGPHAIGGATLAGTQLELTGNFSGGNVGIEFDTTLNPSAGGNANALLWQPTIVEAGSGTHASLRGAYFALTITNGVATTTDAIDVDIATFAAATGTTAATGLRVAGPTGTNPTIGRAIYVTSGTSELAGLVVMTGLTSSSTGDYVCFNTSNSNLVQGTATCTLSSQRYKHDFVPLDAGLATILKMPTYSFLMNAHPEFGRMVGLKAEDVYSIEPRIVLLDGESRPDKVLYENYTAILTKALQEEDAKVERLQKRISMLEERIR